MSLIAALSIAQIVVSSLPFLIVIVARSGPVGTTARGRPSPHHDPGGTGLAACVFRDLGLALATTGLLHSTSAVTASTSAEATSAVLMLFWHFGSRRQPPVQHEEAANPDDAKAKQLGAENGCAADEHRLICHRVLDQVGQERGQRDG